VIFAVLAFLVAIAYLGLKFAGVPFPVGNPTIVIAVAFFSGIQMLSLGVIGEYVGRIYDESVNGRSTSSRVQLRLGAPAARRVSMPAVRSASSRAASARVWASGSARSPRR
jgi:hypothetical protein